MSYQLTIAHKPGTIECDFKGLNAYVESQIQKYDGLVVTEEQIKDAEKNMADLNKMKDLIEDRRKEIKKEITIPYTEFEKNIKPIVKRIDEVRGKIKEQVDAFKEQEKAEKKKRICDWWKENGKQTVPIEKIWNEQWLNKGTTDKQWQADLKQRKERITADLAMIVSLGDQDKINFLLTDYIQTLDITASMQNWDRHEQARIAAEEERQRIEQERAERAARQAAEQAQREAERAKQAQMENVPAEPETAPQAPKPAPQEPAKDDPNDYLYTREFKCIDMTYQQIWALNNFMKEMKIKFIVNENAKSQRRK